jgi:hypothetical protein
MFGFGGALDSVLGSGAVVAAKKWLLEEERENLVADGLSDTASYNAAAEADARRRMVNSPAGLVKNLAKIGGFVAGRSEETEDGTQITIGDPGTSDLADAATGASGLIDLMQGDVGVGNLADAAGVAFDAGVPGPPIAPMLGAILPINRVKAFAGTLADATGAIISKGARESSEEFVKRTTGLDVPAGVSQVGPPDVSFDQFSKIIETGNPRTFREILDDIDVDAALGEPPGVQNAAHFEEALQATKNKLLRQLPLTGGPDVPVAIPVASPNAVGTAYFPNRKTVEGDPFDVFGTVVPPDAPGNTVIGLQTEVDPGSGLIRYMAETLENRTPSSVATHEIQHAVNKFVPKFIAKDIANSPDAMAAIDNVMHAKYGTEGVKHYRSRGRGTWIDEGLAVLGETGSFDLLGNIEGVEDLTEVNRTFRDVLSRISPPSETRQFQNVYEYATDNPALKQVNDQINNWGDRTGTIVFDTKRVR